METVNLSTLLLAATVLGFGAVAVGFFVAHWIAWR
jgi:nitroreductase